jgi:hypothetical protein
MSMLAPACPALFFALGRGSRLRWVATVLAIPVVLLEEAFAAQDVPAVLVTGGRRVVGWRWRRVVLFRGSIPLLVTLVLRVTVTESVGPVASQFV